VAWSSWLVTVALAGCGRLHFDPIGGDSGGVVDFSCARSVPTTPTYWANTNTGSDGNPGTQALPTKTILEALTLASTTGGTVVVGSGNYLETLNITTAVPLLLLSEQQYGATFQRLNCVGCANLWVEGFQITGSTAELVQITNGTNITIKDNIAYHGSSAGIRVSGGGSQVDVAGNIISDTFSAQVHVNVATDVHVHHNVAFGYNGATVGEPMIWFESATNSSIASNVVFRALGNNQTFGEIGLGAITGATLVENNLFAGSPNATDVYTSIAFDQGSGGASIRNNTFVGPFPGPAFGIGVSAVMAGADFQLVNNIWASASTTQPFTVGTAPAGSVTLRHNLYWNAPLGPFTAGGFPTPADDAEARVADPGLSFALSAEPNWTPPMFVGGATTICDVHTQLVEAMAKISSTSPAVGAADPTQSPTVDIRGHTRPTHAALGAYEP
jgi:hypothetical protein